MKKLSGDQRGRVGEKIMEWGNLLFAGLVIGQFVTPTPFRLSLAFVGAVGMLGAYFIAVLLMRGGK